MFTILKDTSIYTFGNVLSKGIGFLAIVLYAHFLPKESMGAYGYILIILGFVNTFIILGGDNAYARYFFEFKSEKSKQVLTTTLFVFLTAWVVSITVVALFFIDDITILLLNKNSYTLGMTLAFFTLPLTLISSLSNQALRNQFQTKQFVVFNFVTVMINVSTATLLLSFTTLGIAAIFIGMLVGHLLVLPFRLYSIRHLFTMHLDFSILKKLLAYGVPFLPASVAYWIFSSADRVMLESMTSLENVGVYTVAVSLSSVMSILANAIGQAWSPHAVRAYEEDQEKAKELYSRFLTVLIAVAMFIIFTAAMIGKEVLTLLFPPAYHDVFYPMLFLLSAAGFQITTQVTAIGIGLKKKTIYLVYITLIVAIINIMLNYILIPKYAEIGASLATIISYILLTVLYANVSQKLFEIKYNFKLIFLAFMLFLSIFILITLNMSTRLMLFGIFIGIIWMKRKKIMETIQ